MHKKQKLIFLFLFVYFTLNICKAKDSTFVFKTAIGTNWCNWLADDLSYSENWGGKYYKEQVDSSYSQNKFLSPIAYIKFTKIIHDNISFFISEKYNYSIIEYIYNQTTGSLSIPTWYYSYKKVNHTFFANQFTSSLGFEIELQHFYLDPKLEFAYSYFSETIKSTTTYSYKSDKNIEERKGKKDIFSYGCGANLGYNFKIKNLPFFIEYQIDFHTLKDLNQSNFFNTTAKLKQLNNSLMVGIRF